MHVPWYIGWPIVIAFAVGILFIVASRAPYYPIKYPSGFWELQSKLGAEDVWLLTPDGVRLHAWLVRAPQESLVTLYLHGNAGNLTHRFLPIREITAAGSSVLMLGRSLFDAAPEPKCFIEIPGAGHNDLVETAGSGYRERLHEFYGHLQ